MADGTQKAALAQELLGRGGAELIPVFNQLAGEGFEKAREEAEKFGLLIDGDTAESFKLLKKSMSDVEDVGKGITTQFTAGLGPAVTDVANAIVKATTKDGVGGFRKLGEEAGKIFKDMTLVAVAFTDTVVRSFWKAGEDTKNIGKAIGDVFTLGFSAANKKLGENIKSDYARIDADLQSREQKIFEELDGTTRLQDAANDKKNQNNRNAGPEKPVIDETAALAALKRQEQEEAFAKSEFALLRTQLQDEIEVFKANAQQREQIEKSLYDQSQLTTAEYYARRKTDLQGETEKEIAILQAQLSAEKGELARARQDQVTNAAKAKQFGQASPVGKEYAAAATKNNQDALAALAKIDELQTKIDVTKVNAATKALALDQQKSKADDQSEQQTLDFEKQLAELQGKRQESARAEIEAETKKRSDQIAQAGGDSATQARLKAELEQWKQLKLAVAAYDDAKKKTEEDTKAFEIAKQAIELNQKSGKISPLESEREINQLIKDRLPLLKADADAQIGAAQKTGNQDNIAQAQQQKAEIQNLTISAEKLGKTLGQSVAGDFTTFFETVGRGTQSVAKSFEKLAGSVVQSIEQILIKLLLLKIAQSATNTGFGQSSFGSGFLSAFSGKAEGGLIKGPGGPKSDSIPARLSAGEYVVKADAVTRFGAHNLEAINRGMNPQPFANLAFPKFAEGGLVGSPGAPGASGNVSLASISRKV